MMIGQPRRRGRNPETPTSDLVIAFDGDDTLWHNESLFSITQDRFRALLRDYVEEEEIDRRLLATETRNLRVFGYGVKGFMLSMIETAIDVSGGRISSQDIQRLIDEGKSMIGHPVELLDGVSDAVEELGSYFRLMLITKGDLFDQESKIARSGLADRFWKVEIVSEKDERAYARILEAHGIDPDSFVMVGNSIRSDVLPAVTIGAWAVHVPYLVTWAHERTDIDLSVLDRARAIESIGELPGVIEEIVNGRRSPRNRKMKIG